jgi:hypothetical protein
LKGFAFFVGFPKNGFCPVFARPNFACERFGLVQKNGEAMRGLKFCRKTETPFFRPWGGNPKRQTPKSDFETEKHRLFFPQTPALQNSGKACSLRRGVGISITRT